MTLTAITNEHRLFNPSALIESGEPESDVVFEMRRLSGMGLYCPHCYQRIGEMVPVKFRNPNERRKHFFHLDALGDVSECQNYSRESEDHMEAKAWLKEKLAREYGHKAIVEMEKLLKDGETRRTPDVLVTYQNGAKEAHEIQFSPINLDGLKSRTEDLKAMGCVVIWYLAGKNWTGENRDYLRSIGVQYFKLYRHDDQFKWKPDECDERPKRVIGGDADDCGRRLKTQAGCRQNYSTLVKGARVTNDKGWHGTIKQVEDCSTCPGGKYYQVYWEERANHEGNHIAKQPIVGHTEDQIWRM